MRITLFDKNQDICRHWDEDFYGVTDVTVACCDFLEIQPHQCIVSPGNSFGFMDGDFDAALRNYFGDKIQATVKKRVERKFGGIQPVGTSMMVRTGDKAFFYIAHTPTMLYPMDISGTMNVFLAFRAALMECYKEGIDSLACCGLGGLFGKMRPADVSKQMRIAYNTMDKSFPDWKAVQYIRSLLGDPMIAPEQITPIRLENE